MIGLHSRVFVGALLVVALAVAIGPSCCRAQAEEEEPIHPFNSHFTRRSQTLGFLRTLLVGFKPALQNRLKAGRALKLKAAKTFTTGRGIAFRRGDVVQVKRVGHGLALKSLTGQGRRGLIIFNSLVRKGIIIIDSKTGVGVKGRMQVGKGHQVTIAGAGPVSIKAIKSLSSVKGLSSMPSVVAPKTIKR